MKKITLFFAVFLTMASTSIVKAQASTPFVGQIAFVPYQQAPAGWADCNGQLLPISSNSLLYSLLGNRYGGNGVTHFALPDMRGRVLVDDGTAVGSTTHYIVGDKGGEENVTLTVNQMPAHTHTVNAVTSEGNQNSATNNLPADTKGLDKEYSSDTANTTMKATMVNSSGGGQSHENRQPYLTFKCIIALTGVMPTF